MLAVEETPLFHPEMVEALVREMDDDVAGALLVTRIPAKADLGGYLRKNWTLLRPGETARLAARVASARLARLRGKPATVRSALAAHGVETFDVSGSINSPDCLAFVRKQRPDVIINSQPQILGAEILRIPAKCWLNRHHSLLPAYGGVMPVFHALRNSECTTGVSVHVMDEQIDTGPVLVRREIRIAPNDTVMSLYDRLFEQSVPALLEALAMVRSGEMSPLPGARAASYYSMPKAEDWQEFRTRGRRFA